MFAQIDLLQCDVNNLGRASEQWVDTVLMNPPFGTRNKHADTLFLVAGCAIANSCMYSLHKRSTREYLMKWAEKYDTHLHTAWIPDNLDFVLIIPLASLENLEYKRQKFLLNFGTIFLPCTSSTGVLLVHGMLPFVVS